MSKGLDALKEIKDNVLPISCNFFEKDCNIIEKELNENVKYKTTEKELGISIFTLVEVGQKCFFRHYDEIKFVDKNIEVDFKEKRILIYYNPFSDNPLAFPFSDYGKNFASTREELEK